METEIFLDVVVYLPSWLEMSQEEKIIDKAFTFGATDLDVIASGPFPCAASYITFRVEEANRAKAVAAADQLKRYVKRFKPS